MVSVAERQLVVFALTFGSRRPLARCLCIRINSYFWHCSSSPAISPPTWMAGWQTKQKKRRARRFLLCCFWPELISAQSNLAKNVKCWLQWPRIWGKSKAERIAPYATIKSKFRAKHRFCYHKNNIEYSHKILQILSSNIATTSCWKKCRNSFCLWIPATQNTISIVLKCFINNKKKKIPALAEKYAPFLWRKVKWI